MRTGILGGTFNPVHNGHLYMAFEAKERLKLDRLILLPNYQPPHKDAQGRDPQDALAMLNLVFSGEEGFLISRFELEKKGLSFTVDTLEHFSKIYPEDELFLLMGEDSYVEFSQWRNPQRILELATLVVFERKFYPEAMRKEAMAFIAGHGGKVHLLDSRILEISSSDIRARVKNGLEIRYLVPEEVRTYIEKHGLYQEQSLDGGTD